MSEDQQGLQIPEGYWFLGNPEQRTVIKRRAIDMVEAAQDAGTVVFLDKTARPLGDLFRSVFPIVYPDKRVPNIRFVNLGTEKTLPVVGPAMREMERQMEADPSKRTPPLPSFRDGLPFLKTQEDLERTYGTNNVAQLSKILKPSDKPERRLIVDETDYSGDTKALAERVFGIVDPTDEYSFFSLIESDEDKKVFEYKGRDFFPEKGLIKARVPWQGYSVLYNQDPEYYDISFTLSGVFDKRRRDIAMKLKDELRMLANEIKQERLPA